jgi:hypothetical protein
MQPGLKRMKRNVRGTRGSFSRHYWVKEDIPHPHEARRKTEEAGRTTVSKHLKFEPGFLALHSNRGVEAGLHSISAVHSIPQTMPRVPVKVLLLAANTNGRYLIGDAKTSEVHINRICAGPRATTAHEIGHYLDHHLWGTGKPGLSNMGTHQRAEELEPLMRAIYNTPSARRLVQQAQNAVVNGDVARVAVCRYLLTPTELFARSYAQYIAIRSGNPAMRLDVRAYPTSWSKYGYAAQWQDHEFGAIAHEMDRLLQRRGLLNEGLPPLRDAVRLGVGRR